MPGRYDASPVSSHDVTRGLGLRDGDRPVPVREIMKLFWVTIVGALAHLRADAEPPLLFDRHDLSPGDFGQVTQGMGAGDVDGDGRIDLVVGGDEYLLLYRNPDFTPSLIAG